MAKHVYNLHQARGMETEENGSKLISLFAWGDSNTTAIAEKEVAATSACCIETVAESGDAVYEISTWQVRQPQSVTA